MLKEVLLIITQNRNSRGANVEVTLMYPSKGQTSVGAQVTHANPQIFWHDGNLFTSFLV